MARRMRQTSSRSRMWVGYSFLAPVTTGAIAAGSVANFPLVIGYGSTLSGLEERSHTIQRTRGEYGFEVPAGGAGVSWLVGIGWIVMSERLASTLSVGTLTSTAPGPLSDPAEPWFTYDVYAPPDRNNTCSRGSFTNDVPAPVDSKAQRIVKAGETPVLMGSILALGGTSASVTAPFQGVGRILILEG